MNVIFDLDGTLIDSAADIQHATGIILGRLGREPLSLREVREFVGEGAHILVSRMMAARDIAETAESHARVYADLLGEYEHTVERAVFYPGVVDALAVLRASSHKLGLCTNKPEAPARAVVRYMNLAPLLDGFVAGGMVASRKPEPEMLWRCIEEMGGGATLYVGDSETDAETAARASVPFALYTEGYRKLPVAEIPHRWAFAHFDHLPGIVSEAAQGARQA